jgi:hypothetical protein
MSDATFEATEAEVGQWLDPIAGLDQRAEILRAAVSILVERGGLTITAIGGVLVTAWLQTQNVTDGHRRELASLAPNMPEALLDAVERSDAHAQASARLWAVNTLRAIPRTEGPPLTAIVARIRTWFSIVSRDVDNSPEANADFERRRAERYRARIGVDASGTLTVLGIELRLVDRDDGRLQAAAPSILEGFPLAKIIPCFANACRFDAETSGSDHGVPNCRRSSTLRTQPAQSELSFANAMHQLDTGDRDDGVSKVLETQHHSDPLLHTSVVLLDQVVQVLRRP